MEKRPLISLINFLNLGSLFTSKAIPFKTAYKYAKIKVEAQSAQVFYTEHLKVILDEYCEKDAENKYINLEDGSLKVKEGKILECNEKLKELQELPWDINEEYFFIPDELNDIEVTQEQIEYIMPFMA